MGIPQIIFIVILAMSLGINLTRHGEKRDGEYNAWIALLATAIETGLLIWGGFFT